MSPERSIGVAFGSFLLAQCICLALGPPDTADPLVFYISQERYVNVHALVGAGGSSDSDSDREETPDLGPFESDIGVDVIAVGPGGSAATVSSAYQSSVIGDDSIQAFGSILYDVNITGGGYTSFAGATSKVYCTFFLTEESDYALQGTLDADGLRSSLRFIGSSGPIHEWSTSFYEQIAVQESGTLPTGEYAIEIKSSHTGGTIGPIFFFKEAAYDITLQFGPVGFGDPGGEVPDDEDVPGGPPLTVDRLSDDFVRLNWGPSCRLADGDYAVYEGELGDPLSLEWVTCSTGGQLTYEFQPTEDAAWFLVVPTDGVNEGSYGDTGDGVERLPSPDACLPQLLGEPVCP